MDGVVLTCANCAAASPAGARFCMSCGTPFAVSCPACGHEQPAAARFCPNCGHQHDGSAAVPAAGATTTVAVTQALAEELRGQRNAGERRVITILFCDVADSTATAEHLDPETWTEVMAAAIDRMVAPVERYGGTVARLMGDAILAYFGAPVAHEDDPQRALLAAIEIREGCRELADEVAARHGLQVAVRIGVNTGLVVVGEMGSERHNEYAALGDAANVAARMEQTAQPGTIRVTGATRRRVAPFFDFELVGSVQVKGRTDPVETFVLGDVRQAPGQLRGLDGITSSMIGRDAELATLRGRVDQLAAGQGGVVSIIAEAGLGKSRLVAELAAAVAEEHPSLRWLRGTSHSYQDTVPYTPFRLALVELLGLHEDRPEAEQSALVARAVGQLAPQVDGLAAYLCWLLGLPAPDGAAGLVSGMDPPTLRGRVFEAVLGLLTALADQTPTILVIDDLHWADAASLELLEALLPRLQFVPLLLVLALRPRREEASWDVHEAAQRILPQQVSTIALQPLGGDDSRALLAELLRVEGLSTTVRSVILDAAEGNPFYVEEVVRSLLESGVIQREGEGFVTTREVTRLEVPESLEALLVARLDALDETARRAIQYAAVIGREFPVSMLRAVAGDDGFDDALSQLLRRELIEHVRASPERVLGFHHALTREAAHGTLLLSTRRAMHATVGGWIEQQHPELVHELARHFLAADEPDRALPHLVAAGEESFAAYAVSVAVDHFSAAIDLWQPTHGADLLRRAYEGLGAGRMHQADMAGAAATYTEMGVRAEQLGDQAMATSALNKLGLVNIVGLGDYEAARGHLDAARIRAEDNDDAEGLAEFYVSYCILNTTLGELDIAEQVMGEAAQVCFTLDAFHRNYGLTHYAHTLVLQARFDEAWEALERARVQADADQDLLHLASLKDTEAWLHLVGGDPERARLLATESRDEGIAIGAWMAEIYGAWTLAEVSRMLGRFDDAVAGYEAIAAQGGQVGHFGMVAAGHIGQARCRRLAHGTGDPAVAAHLQAAGEALGMPLGLSMANHVHSEAALLLLMDRDIDGAEDHLRAGTVMRSSMINLSRPEVLICSGTVALERGRTEDGIRLLEEGAAHIEANRLGHLGPRRATALGLVAAARGQHGDAMAHLDDAAEQARDLHLLESGLFAHEVGQALATAAADQEGARRHRDGIAQTIGAIAGGIGDPATRSSLLAQYGLVGETGS